MSPYPSKTDRQAIIETACALIERDGIENLSLNEIAAEIGVKTPSLYRYVASKNDLLRAVIQSTFRSLFEVYQTTLEATGESPIEQLHALFHAHRAYAHANPNTYILAYTTTDPQLRTDPDELEQQAIVVQKIMAQITGEKQSLPALRGALALVHGFAMLELNAQLQRGGDLTLAFDAAVAAYLRGWQ